MSLMKEFKAFAIKGNVVDLAVAVVVGTAFTKIVTALVSGVVMPLVGKLLPGPGWTGYQVGGIQVGLVLGAVLDFLIVAFILFIVVVKLRGALETRRMPPRPRRPRSAPSASRTSPSPHAAAGRARHRSRPEPALLSCRASS